MHRPPPAPPRLKPLAQALIAASLMSGWPGLVPAQVPTVGTTALPGGLNVAAGQAQVAVQGAQMTVRNTPGAILNWQRFDIGAAAGVHFEQANAASKVLNRVVGNDPSQILGQLSSNGQVWLLNPNGVLFGHGARVDVAGLLAGSMRMLDSDFLAGRFRLDAPETATGALAGSVVNHGQLSSRFGGQILLVGPRVENTGEVSAPGGHVGLLAGRSVELVDTGLPHLSVKVAVPDDKAEVANLGRLATPGGRIDVYAGIVNQRGLAEAQSLSVGPNGEIVLQASDTLILGAGSRTAAVGHAEGSSGGRIDLVAPQVALVGDAQVDASGAGSGGRVRIGGGLRGQEADIANARALFMGEQASVRADGGTGDGGRIVLWSDEATRAHGTLSASGGAQGQGGFVEVSSKGVLAWTGHADLSVADGERTRYGTLLLDPEFIVIQDTSPSIDGLGNGDLASPNLLFGAFPGATSVITAGALNAQLASANVVLQANLDITVSAPGTPVSGPRALTLQAGRDIIVNSAITANGGLTLSANDPAGTDTGVGRVVVNAPLATGFNALTLSNNGGSGVHAIGANLTASNLTITGDAQIVGTATFQVTGGAGSTGALSGTGSLVKAGTGSLNVNGSSSLAGVTVTGGTLAFQGNAAMTTLTLAGGALRGTGDVAVAGAFNAQGSSAVIGGTGTLTTPGTTTIDFSTAGAALSIEDNRRWVNEGTINLEGDSRILFSRTAGSPTPSLANASSGVVNVNSTAAAPIGLGNANLALFDNAGTLNFAGGGDRAVQLVSGGSVGTFTNSGSVNVAGGSLAIAGNGNDTGTYALGPEASLSFTGGTRTLSTASLPLIGTELGVAGATLTIQTEAATSLLPLRVESGTLNVSAGGSLTLPSLVQTGGTANLASAGGLSLGALDLGGGVLSLTSSFDSIGLPSALSVRDATLSLSAPTGTTVDTLVLDNARLSGNASLTVTGAFTAQGATVVLAGTGTLTTQGVSTVNLSTVDGSLDIVDGWRWVNRGTLNLDGDDRLRFRRTGSVPSPTLENASGAVINLNTTSANPLINDFAVTPVFDNAGTLNKTGPGVQSLAFNTSGWIGSINNTGQVNVAAGTLRLLGDGTDTGGYSVASGAVLEFGLGTRSLSSLSLPAAGGSTLRVSGGAVTATASGATALPALQVSGGATFTLTGAGSLSVESLGQTDGSVLLAASGDIRVPSLTLSGGTVTLRSEFGGSILPAALAVSNAVLNLDGATPTTVTSLSLDNATYGGNASTIVTGNFTASGATVILGGTGTLRTEGTSTVNLSTVGGALQIFDSRRWLNTGTLNLDGDDRLWFRRSGGTPSPTLENAAGGVVNLNTSDATPLVNDGAVFARVVNNGTINKPGTGVQTIALTTNGWIGSFDNNGSFNVAAGTLRVQADGNDSGRYVLGPEATLDFNAGTRSLAGAGLPTTGALMRVSGGSLTIGGDGATTLPALEVSGASTITLAGAASFSLPSIVQTGGTVSLSAQGNLSAAALTLSGGTLTLGSTFGALALPADLVVRNATLNLNTATPISASTLTLETATLGGSASLTVTGAFQALGTGVALRSTGTLTTLGTTTAEFSGAGGLLGVFDGQQWVNRGTLNINGDDRLWFQRVICCSQTPTLTNAVGGVINLNSTNATPLGMDTGITPTFNNAGTLNKLADAAQTFDFNASGWLGSFNNTGTVNVTAGTLRVEGNGNDVGTWALAPAAELEFALGTRTLASASIPSAAAALRVTGAVLTVTGVGATALPATVVSGGSELRLNSPGNVSLPSLSVDGSNVVVNTPAALSVGSYAVTGTSNVSLSAGGNVAVATPTFGGGTTTLASTFGTVSLPSALQVSNATLNLNTAAALSFSSLRLDNATLGGTYSGTVSGAFEALGAFAALRSSGTLTTLGTTTTDFAGTAGDLQIVDGQQWLNLGTINITGDDRLYFRRLVCCSLVPTLTNAPGAVINLDTSNATPVVMDTGIAGTLNNAGTLNKNSTVDQTLSVHNSGWFGSFSNSGTVNVAGGRLGIAGNGGDTGTYNLAPTANLAFLQGTRTLAAASNPAAGTRLSVIGGNVTLQAAGASVTLLPVFVEGGGRFTVADAAQLTMPQLDVSGSSIATLTASGRIDLASATLSATSSLTATAGTDLAVPVLAMSGDAAATLTATAGGLELDTTLSVSNATLTLNAARPLALDSLALSSAVLGGNANITVAGDFTAGGTGVTLRGTGTLTTQGTSTIDFAGTNGLLTIFQLQNWTNTGTINLNGDDAIYFNRSICCSFEPVLSNAEGGVINLNTSNANPFSMNNGVLPVIRNAGIVRKATPGTQTLNLQNGGWSGRFENTGRIEVSAGTLGIGGNFVQAGTVELGSGTTLSVLSSFSNAATGLITGTGTVNVGTGTGTITNRGTLQPGGAGTVGTLSIVGNVDLATGTLALDLGGSGAGVSDRLAVTGNATLSGTADARLAGGYVPAAGDFAPIVTATGTSTGTFASLTGAEGFVAGYRLAAGEASRLVFGASDGLPTLVFSNAGGDLDWNNPANWGGSLPGAGQTAVLSSGFAVGHASGTTQVGGLRISAGSNALAVTGGSFTVNFDARIDGSLSVGGTGSVTLAGPVGGTGSIAVGAGRSLVVNGSGRIANLTLDGGRLDGTGSFAVTGAFSAQGTGATVAGVGTLRTQGTSTVNFSTAGGSLVVQDNRRWINEGTLTLGGDDRLLLGSGVCCGADSPVLTNAASGTLVLASTNTQPMVGNTWAAAQVLNEGLIVKPGGGTQTLAIIPPSGGSSIGVFDNRGTVRVEAGILQLQASGTDTGRYELAADTVLRFAGGERVLEAGSLGMAPGARLSSTAGTTTLALTGAAVLPPVSVSGGVFSATTTGSISAPDYQLSGNGVLNLGSPGRPVILPSTDLIISAGTLGFDGDITLSSLTLTGNGFLGGAGDVTVTGAFRAEGDVNGLTGPGTLRTQGNSLIDLARVNGSFFIERGREWINTGTINLAGDDQFNFGGLSCCGAATARLVNAEGATFNLTTRHLDPLQARFGMSVQVENAGTFNKSFDGNQTLSLNFGDVPGRFDNAGTVNVLAGSLRVVGGGSDTGRYLLAPAARLAFGAGTRVLSPNSNPTGGAGLTIDGATVSLQAPGGATLLPLTVSAGSLDVDTTGGFLAPSVTVSGGRLDVTAAGAVNVSSLNVTGGTVALGGSGALSIPALSLTGGTTLLSSNAAALTLPANVSVVNAVLSLSSPVGTTFSNFTLDNAYLSGSNAVTVNGNFVARGAIARLFEGSGTLTTNGTSQIDLSAANGRFGIFNSWRWINNGTLNLGGDDQIYFYYTNPGGQTPTLVNSASGILNVTSTSATPFSADGGVTPLFENAGTLNKNAGGDQLLQVTSGGWIGRFNNTGVVNVNAGTLRILGDGVDTGRYLLANDANIGFAGGTRSLASDSNPSGSGGLLVSGGSLTLSTLTPTTLLPVTVSGGSFTVDSIDSLTVPRVSVSAGSFSGRAATTATASTVAVSGGAFTLQGDGDVSVPAFTLTGGSATLGSTLGAIGLPASVSATNATLTLDAPVPTNLTNLTLESSDLNGSNTINVSGNFVARGSGARLYLGNGTLNTSGTSTVDFATAGGRMGIFNSWRWNNSGTLNFNGDDQLYFYYTNPASQVPTLANAASGVINFNSSNATLVAMDGGALPRLLNEGTLNKNAAGAQTLQLSSGGWVGRFDNTGTVNVNAGSLRVLGNGTDTGRYELATASQIDFGAGTRTLAPGANPRGGAGLVVSGAALTLDVAESLSLLPTTVSSGALTVSSTGSLGLPSLAVTGGTVSLSSAAALSIPSLSITGGTTALRSGLGGLTLPASLTVTGATLELNAPVPTAFTNLTLESSNLSGNNAVNVSGAFVARGTGATLLQGNGTLTTSGTSTVDFSTVGGRMGIFNGWRWVNSGTLNLNGDDQLYFYFSTNSGQVPSLVNAAGATINLNTSNASPVTLDGGVLPRFDNLGTINKNAAGAQQLQLIAGGWIGSFNNLGSVNVNAGTLRLLANGDDTGRYALAAGTGIDFGLGTRTLSGLANPTGGDLLRVSGGSLSLFTLGASSTLPIQVSGGALELTSTGSLTVPALTVSGGTAALVAADALSIGSPVFTGGTTTLTAGLPGLQLPAALTVANATLSLQSPLATSFTSLTLDNSRLAGSNDVVVSGAFRAQGARVDLQGTGSLTTLGTSTIEMTGSAQALYILDSWRWLNRGTLSLAGDDRIYFSYTGSAGLVPTLRNQAGGVINITSTNATPFFMDAGVAPLLDNAGTLNKGAAGSQSIALVVGGWLGTFNNSGDVNVAAGTLRLQGNGNDTGRYTLATGTELELNSGTRSMGANANPTGGAALRVSGGATTLNLGAGTALLPLVASAGSITVNADGALSVPSLTVSGTSTVANLNAGNGLTLAALSLTGGTTTLGSSLAGVSLPGGLTLTNATLLLNTSTGTALNSLTLDNARLGGSGSVSVSGAFRAQGAAAELLGTLQFETLGATTMDMAGTNGSLSVLDNVRWTNRGTLTVGGDDRILFAFSSSTNQVPTLVNAAGGVIDIRSTNAAPISMVAGTRPLLDNAGVINKLAAGTQSVTMSSGGWIGTIRNTGTIQVDTGELSLVGEFSNGGTLAMANGTTLSTNSAFSNEIGGVIRNAGNATLRVAAGSGALTNQGVIAPGGEGAVGTLTLNGSLVQAAGQLRVDVGGTTAGSYDRVVVSGGATLGGGLRVNQLAGYTPTLADFAPVVAASGTVTGTFASITGAGGWSAGYNLGSGEAVRVIFGGGGGTVGGGSLVFTNAGGDLNWNNPLNWSGSLLPGFDDSAVLSSGFSVTHASGTTRIVDLRVSSGNALAVTGGSFNVAGLTQLGGTLSVSGTGSATLGGGVVPAVVGGTLSVASGRTLTVRGGATLATANVSGTLLLDGNSSLTTLNLNGGTLGGLGDISIAGAMNVGAGSGAPTLAGSGLITTRGNTTINIAGSADVLEVHGSRRWLNTGSISLPADDGIRLGAAAGSGVLTNAANGSIAITGTVAQPLLQSSASTLVNAGLVSKSGTATQRIALDTFDHTGTLAVGAGTLEIGGGNGSGALAIADGATLALFAGTRSVNDTGLPDGGGRLRIAGGTLELNAAGTIDLPRTLITSGALRVTSGGAIDAAELTMSGGSATLDAATVVTLSTLSQSNASLTVRSGAASSLPGALSLTNSTLTLLTPAVAFSSLTLAGSTLGGTADIAIADTLTISGSGNSVFAGTGLVTTNGSTLVNIPGATATVEVAGARQWVNNGSLTIAGDDSITLGIGGAGSFSNRAGGTVTLSGSAPNPFTQSAPSRIDNLGTLAKTSAGTQTLNVTTFNNLGQVDVLAGTLRVGGGSGAGGFSIAAGATLAFHAGSRTLAASAVPTGGGRLLISGGTIGIDDSRGTPLTLPALTVSSGSLRVDSADAIVLPALTLSGGTLSLDAATTVTLPPLSLASTGLSVRAGTGVSLPSAVNLVGSTMTLDSPAVTFSSLTLSGSSLVGATDITVTGNLQVIGGTGSTIGGSGSFTTAGTTTVNLSSGTGNLVLGGGRNWVNTGTILLPGDDGITLGSGAIGATLTNAAAGRIEISGPVASPLTQSAASTVNNAGTIIKSGSAVQRFNVSTFNHTGALSLSGGTLELTGGVHAGSTDVGTGAVLSFVSGERTLAGSAVPAGAGTLRVAGGSLTLDDAGGGSLPLLPIVQTAGSLTITSTGALTTPSLALSGGSATLRSGAAIDLPVLAMTGGSLGLDAATTVTLPNLNLTGTTLDVRAGTGVSLPSAATLSASTLVLTTPAVGFSSLSLAGSTLSGTADISVTGAFNVIGTTGSVIGGSGGFSTAGTSRIDISGAPASLQVAAGRTWTNTGNLSVLGDDSLQIGNGGNGGLFINAAGATLTLASSAPNVIAQGGTTTFNNAGTLVKTGPATQRLNVGTFSHTGALVVEGGTLELLGGGHAGTTTVAPGATLAFSSGSRSIAGAAVPAGGGRMLVNGGDLSLSDGGGGSLTLLPTVLSGGSLAATSSGSLVLPELVVSGGAATLAGDTTVALSALGLTGGSLSIDAGTVASLPTLSLAGTSLAVRAGSSVSLPSSAALVSTTLTLNTPSATLGSLSLANSVVNGSGELIIGTAFDVSGSGDSTVGGSGVLRTQGTSNVSLAAVGGSLQVSGTRSWINTGTLTVGGDDSITLGAGGVAGSLINAAGGTLVLASTHPTPLTQSAVSSFTNDGTLSKAGPNTASINLGTVNNRGTLAVGAGRLVLPGTLVQAGTITTATGTTLQTAGSLVNTPAGVITGTGTLRLGAGGNGTLTNAGTIRPGASPGTTTIAGNLDLTGGTLDVELGGLNPGVDSDLLVVTGNVVLGGALNATLFGGWVPADGDSIPFVRHGGTSTGLFATSTLPGGFAVGYRLASGESARTIFSAFGDTRVFTNAGGDLSWNTPTNWDSGFVPGVLDTAVISSGFSVVHGSGSNAITGLTINDANALDVTGGTLVVSGDTVLLGTLRVSGSGTVLLGGDVTGGAGTMQLSGGSLQLNGATDLRSLSLSGGSLGGSGSLTVTGSYARGPAATVGSSFTGLTLTQSSGTLDPGAWTVAGPVELTATTGSVELGAPVAGTQLRVASGLDVRLLAGGRLTATATSGDSLVVDATAAFSNAAGATALATSGTARWLVYSGTPVGDTPGGLVPAFRQYDAIAGVTPIQGSGNGFLHGVAPTLTVSLTGSVSKVYDTTTSASLAGAGVSFGGLLGTDTAALASPLTTGSFDNKNVGGGKLVSTAGLSVSVTDSLGGFPVFGVAYDGTASGAIGTITPAPLVVSGLAGGTRVYDATTNAPITGTPSVTALGSDVVSVVGLPTAAFADKNVGSGKAIVITGLTLGGVDGGNYTAVAPASLTGEITRAPLPLTGLVAASRVYDATTVAPLSGTAGVTPLGTDDVAVAGVATGAFADKNVGIAKPVTLSGLTLTGLDAANYDLVLPGTLSADVTARPLPVLGLAASSRVYDGSTVAALSGSGSVTPLAGDSVVLAGTPAGSFADKNVGTAKPVVLSGLSLSGADAANYVPVAPVGLLADITPRPLAIGGLVAADKVYDGGTAASFSGVPTVSPLAGDSVTVLGTAVGSFADRNAGTAKPVLVSGGLTFGGTDGGNYLPLLPADLTADISARPLLLTGLVALDKVYDGTTVATLSGTASIAPLAGDLVSLAGVAVGAFADRNAGAAKPVSVGGLGLIGTDSANYTLQLPAGLVARIERAPLPLAGLTALDRTYDGSTVALLSGTPGVTPLAGDAVSLAGTAVGAFATRDAGVAKPVSVSGLSLSGADAGNYLLQVPTTLVATVSPALLSLQTLAAADKVYDGQAAATLSGTLGGVFGADSVGLVLSGSFAGADAGVALGVDWTARLSGTDAANYTLVDTSGRTTASILPATLTYTATRVTAVAGTPLRLDGTVEGFVAGETLASATTGTLLWTTPASATSPAGSYAIEGAGLGARNYVFVQAPGNADALTLTPAFVPDSPAAVTTAVIGPAVAAVTLPRVFSTPTFGRVLDVTPTLDLDGGFGFRRINTAQMTRDEIAAVLAARANYKRRIFADSLSRLEQDPTLADARPCRNEREIETGSCLVTESLLKEIQALREAARQRAEAAAAAQAQGAVQAAAQSSAQAVGQALPGNRVRIVEAALPVIERKFALVIGINKYSDRRIPELLSAVNDAQGVGRALEQRFGYETEVLPDATRESVLRALNRLAVEARPGDSVVIYYAGHGVLLDDKQQGFWLPADADADKPESWMSNADINRLVGLIQARQLLLISDSCFSGQLVGSERVQVASGVEASTLLGKRAAVVMSSGGDEPVSDEGRDGHSVFTWHLLQRLNAVDAWRPGSNVFETLRDAVRREFPQTPQYGAARAAGHQAGADYVYERRVVERNAPQPTPAPAPAPVPQPAPAPGVTP